MYYNLTHVHHWVGTKLGKLYNVQLYWDRARQNTESKLNFVLNKDGIIPLVYIAINSLQLMLSVLGRQGMD